MTTETRVVPGNVMERADEVLGRLSRVVLGQDTALRQMLITLLAGGHALLEGVPGTAKTLAIRSLGAALRLDFGRAQFTPDLMPTDLTGVNIFDESRHDFVFRPGPVFTDLLLADEINRAPAKTQAALLEAMQERQVTVDGVTHTLGPAFTVFASQNPVEYEGTYPLPEAQLDRFMLKIIIDYPPEPAERAILDRYADGFDAERPETYGIEPVLGRDDLLAIRSAIATVHVEPSVRDYIVRIARATRDEPTFALGASPRAGVALFLAARTEAALAGRDFVTPDDVKSLVAPVLRHRLLLTPEAEIEGRSVDEQLEALLGVVPAPR